MRKIFLAGVLATGLMCSACQTTWFDTPPNFNQTLADEKGLLVAEAAYTGVGTLLEAAVDNGQLTGQRARRARELNQEAFAALQLAHKARDAGNQKTLEEQAIAVMAVIAEIQALINNRQ